MIESILSFSLRRPFFIVTVALFLALGSFWSIKHTPLDALPDLSAPQVILELAWEGQSPQIIQDQATYPLISQLLTLSEVQTVRGFASFGTSFIYVIFKEGTDLYWARSRVAEQLASIALPQGAKATLGPDTSGVGWIFQYALVSKTHDLAQLRTIQDYYYKYAFLEIDGVSDVASLGGFVPTFEIVLDHEDLMLYNLSIQEVINALKSNHIDTGGRIVVQNGFEWIVQAKGLLEDFSAMHNLVITRKNNLPITLGDIATFSKVPSNRRGLAELNGKGEVVGGIIMMRYGANAHEVLKKIHAKLPSLERDDVTLIPVYDRSTLIDSAMGTLKTTLIEESVIVIAIIALFLLHLRSSLIFLVVLPLTVGTSFFLMYLIGVGSNIMSLAGIAIAIGTMVDATIVMIENAHKTLAPLQAKHGTLSFALRKEAILASCSMVGRPIFMALWLVVVSFLPIFALTGQEGALFTPLAFTKTFAMAVGALLSITLVPVLLLFLVKEVPQTGEHSGINGFFIRLYAPVLALALRYKKSVLTLFTLLMLSLWPLYHTLQWEFMPPMHEHDLMYMPVTPFGISIDQSKALLKQTNAIIASHPEVAQVFGKAGRAQTATDPAPLSMLETIITLKPQTAWREGMTYEKIQSELDTMLEIPGLINTWTYPIRGRVDMLLSGIRTPLGIKLYGEDARTLETLATHIETTLRDYEGTQSVVADKTSTGYFLDITPIETQLSIYHLTKEALFSYISAGVGGMGVATLYDGMARYGIAVRFQSSNRDDIEHIKAIQVKTPLGFVPLETLANVTYRQGPSIIKSEMAQPVTHISIMPKEHLSPQAYQKAAQELLNTLKLPQGYTMQWEGQSRYLEQALETIMWMAPVVVALILLLIYLALQEVVPTLMVFATLPLALLGGLMAMQGLNYSMSVAVVVGFLALLGVAAETAIVMMVYLRQSVQKAQGLLSEKLCAAQIDEAVYQGALLRLRPKLMTIFSLLAGLLPLMFSQGVGSQIMQRIAAPMMGGVISSALLSLIVLPVLYHMYLTKESLDA